MHQRLGRIATQVTIVVSCAILCASVGRAATITVNSLADDVFPDATGAIFDVNNAPIALASSKCTLRMAIASANLDLAVGGVSFGCGSGSGTDTIDFAGSLSLATTPGMITLASKLMNVAPAVNTTSILIASTPMTITGPGSAQLTLDGSVAGVDGRRILSVSNGDQDVDFQFNISGLRFLRGRTVDTSSGCMFSRESVSITDVIFESCESVGGATSIGFGGALGVGNQTGGTAVPTVSVTNSKFLGNRSVRGTSTGRPEVGGAFFGSGIVKVGAVTLTNVTFNGNSSEWKGAMNVQNATSVTISGSHFIGNAATGTSTAVPPIPTNNGRFGGFQIVTVSGDVTINNGTRINGNVANEERAGFSIQQVGGTVTLNEVDVTGNYVNRGRIGGFEVLTDNVFNPDGSCTGAQLRPVNISNVRVLGNSVATSTGGFRILCSGAVTITDSIVAGNETRGYRLAQTDVVSTGNSAFQIFADPYPNQALSTATLTRVTVEGNTTDATGGGGGYSVAMIERLGAFTADSLRFVNNSVAQNQGLTLRALGAGRNYLITNSEFSGNSAAQIPALFMETDGNYTLRNSTVSANVARNGGGSTVKANANTSTPGGVTFAIEHSTIARNTGNFEQAFGVAIWANPTLFSGANAVVTVKNSILGRSSPGLAGPSLVGFDPSITNITATNTLLEWTGGAPASFCTGAGMKCNAGSLVSPLANNGGTDGIRTMALMAGSPAINAGGAVLGGLTTDQRGAGFPRTIGGVVDMGAYESDPATTVGCTLDLDGNGAVDALTDGLLSLRAMLGLTDTAATNGAIGGSPTRPNWTAIRNYLNANCGSSF